jgi:hypothetical protein
MNADPKCPDESFNLCENNSKCHLCDGTRLFKRPKWMDRRDKEKERKLNKTPKKKKEGMDFEKRVQKRFNQTVNKSSAAAAASDSARRRPNSGAIWSMPGDIITKEQLFECKERGSKNSKGEFTISIQKSQLEKVRRESQLANRDTWYYVFGFKGDDKIYLVKDYEDELNLIQQIEIFKARILELENKIDGDDNVGVD